MNISKETKSEKYGWFINKLSNDFRLNLNDKSKVIFGYNGIGKTTLSNLIFEKYQNFVYKLSYEEELDFSRTKDDNLIEIELFINEIETLSSSIKEIENKVTTNGILRELGISNKGLREKFSIKKDEIIRFYSSKEDIKKFYEKFPNINKDQIKRIVKFYDNIKEASDSIDELDKFKNNSIFELLSTVDKTFSNGEICPICNSVIDWKQAVKEKLKKIDDKKTSLVQQYSKNNIIYKLEDIDEDIKVVSTFDGNPCIQRDILLSTSFDEYENLSNQLIKYDELYNRLEKLKSEANVYFDCLIKEEQNIRKTLYTYYDLADENIIFDKKEKIIKIVFPRKINTYSTGEIHLLKFMFKLYSFIGSDKTTLILDDPSSSFDMIHQYKIAFEIMKHARFVGPNNHIKNIIIFTHNADMINIMNSQSPKQLDYYYLEQYDQQIFIDKIDPKSNYVNLISINQLDQFDDLGIINYLKNRDNLGEEQSFFHYSEEPKIIHDISTDNHKLISLIDELSLEHKDFYINSYIKVISLCVLRIWLEKKMYETIPENDEGTKKDFLKATTIGAKICVFSNKCNASIREKLMPKKVMLNQSVHYDSLVAPFSFAMNLSLDDLKNEVNSIKEIFNNINNK